MLRGTPRPDGCPPAAVLARGFLNGFAVERVEGGFLWELPRDMHTLHVIPNTSLEESFGQEE